MVSKSRGGTLADKIAMSDGVGSILIKSINGNTITLNNAEYNQLLLLNKEKLTDTMGLKELIASGDIIVDASTLNSINGNSLSNPTGLHVDGTSCDDNNPLTTNDIYTNNVCLGTNIDGTSCDDGDSATTGETWLNGVCQGGTIPLPSDFMSFVGDPFILGVEFLTTNEFTTGGMFTVNIKPNQKEYYIEFDMDIHSAATELVGFGNGNIIGYNTSNIAIQGSVMYYYWPSPTKVGFYVKVNDNGTYTCIMAADTLSAKKITISSIPSVYLRSGNARYHVRPTTGTTLKSKILSIL